MNFLGAFLLLLGIFINAAFAQFDFFGGNTGSPDDEKALRQRAKTRAYPGGKDEEPLRVQPQLNFAQRKMMPAQEAPEQESEVQQGTSETD